MADAFFLTKVAMEQELPATQTLIDSILESTVDAAVLVSNEFKILHITSGFTELTGQSNEEYYGKEMEALKISDFSAIRRVIKTGTRHMAAHVVIGGRALLANIVPVKLDNEIIGAVVMVLFSSMAVLKRAISAFDRESADSTELYDQISRKSGSYTFGDFIGDSHVIETLITQCHRISHSHHPILLMGETGVGKEIIASGVFAEYSGAKHIPFVKINCSAIPRDLLESELFGHEKGAFTGAAATKKGKFELAAGGVLLLDEIGDMDLSLQSKLLRVIEEREFERIGGNKVIPLTARIIASTNQNLKKLAAEGRFRMDLYYRLNTFEINIPPLRAHKEDIPKLIDHFTRQDGLSLEFTDGAYNMLLDYQWPGNVRELRNVLNRLNFLYPDSIIGEVQVFNATGEMFSYVELPEYRTVDDPLPAPIRGAKKKRLDEQEERPAPPKPAEVKPAPVPETEKPSPPRSFSVKEQEKLLICEALEKTDYNMTKTARLLGIGRSTLYSRIKTHGISIDKGIK